MAVTDGRDAPERRMFELGRIGGVSDGVIAIALTLLVLELKIPEAEIFAEEGMFVHLGDQLPNIVGWLISFVFIGIVWHEQHLVFAFTKGTDTGFILVNFFQLACVAVIPFASAMLGDFSEDEETIIFFSGVMMLNSIAMAAVAAYLASHRHLHARPEAAAFRQRARFHLLAGAGSSVLAIAMAYWQHPLIGAAIWLIAPFLVAFYHVRIHPRALSRHQIAVRPA